MRTLWILFLLVVSAAPCAAAKVPACPGGRYIVAGPSLTGMPATPEAVDMNGRMVSVQSGCPAAKARVRGTRKGTKVRVRWKSCPGLVGAAVFKGTMMEECRTLAGTFTARKAGIVKPFIASMSLCGDGVWDPAGGESCDAGVGPCGALCSSCACPGEVPTTSTTLFGATTTTTVFGLPTTTSTTTVSASTSTSSTPALPTTSTTSTTLAGPDLRPHAWMSPGSAPDGTNILVEFTVRNFGTQTATGPWYDYINISPDYAFGGDQNLIAVQRVANLGASSQYTVQVNVPIPAGLTAGTYYLYLQTDGTNAVAENNETNNVGAFVQLIVN